MNDYFISFLAISNSFANTFEVSKNKHTPVEAKEWVRKTCKTCRFFDKNSPCRFLKIYVKSKRKACEKYDKKV
jgi:hypothetical protein